ncbi:MAG: succinate dehydrogenase, cytochrome b556 subunit [Casimicrobium sp.]
MSDTPLAKTRARPVYRNIGLGDLARYRMPIPAIASIVHRATGIALFVCLLFLLAMLQMSLKSEAGFEAFRSVIWVNPIAKIVLLGLLFALIFHLVAGVRHLIQDSTRWLDLAAGRSTAFAAFGISVALTALIAWRLV